MNNTTILNRILDNGYTTLRLPFDDPDFFYGLLNIKRKKAYFIVFLTWKQMYTFQKCKDFYTGNTLVLFTSYCDKFQREIEDFNYGILASLRRYIVIYEKADNEITPKPYSIFRYLGSIKIKVNYTDVFEYYINNYGLYKFYSEHRGRGIHLKMKEFIEFILVILEDTGLDLETEIVFVFKGLLYSDIEHDYTVSSVCTNFINCKWFLKD